MNEIHSSKKISYSWRGMLSLLAQHMNAHSDDPCKGGTQSGRNKFLRCSAAPMELKKYVETINPGLAPWAMQECRPYRALLKQGLNQLLCDFDVLTTTLNTPKAPL